MKLHTYPFQAEISVNGFTVKEYELIAEFAYTPACKGSFQDGLQMEPDEDEYIEINTILSNETNPTPDDIIIASMLDNDMDTDQLVDEIWNSREEW